ncbi:MAG: hypothetical protein ACXWUG_25890 [Polyangiales bacterium]
MRLALTTFALTVSAAALLFAAPASATTIIKDPNPPKYKLEVEPHLDIQYFGWDHSANGFGPGVRFSIPIVSPGFIPKLNNSVAISFGADFLHYSPAYRNCQGNVCGEGPDYWVLYLPVAMQWNFWITDKISAFGEPGLLIRTDFGRCDVAYCGSRGSPFYPVFNAGARFHFWESVALTVRAGYPTGLSVGASIFF